jgi:hypothetical protein
VAITNGMYNSYSFYYEASQPVYTIFGSDDDLGTSQYYQLSDMFESISTYPYQTNMDCADIANYLTIAFNAAGVSGAPRKHFPNPWAKFDTHELLGLGHYVPISYEFNFHQTGGNSSLIYDAAAAHLYDLQGNSFNAPPAGWPEAGYWQSIHPNPPSGGSHYLGLVWRYTVHENLPEGETVSRQNYPVTLLGYAN